MKLVAYILRHGSSGDDEQYNSPVNDPLDSVGRGQAYAAAQWFKDKPVGKIVTSGLKRAKETADIIGDKIGKTPKIDDRVDSLNVGNVKDMPSSDEADRVIKHHAENPSKKIPGGESFDDFRAEVHPALKEAVEDGNAGDPTLVISHHSIQHEAGNLFNGDHESALSKPGGAIAVYKTDTGYKAVPVFKPEKESMKKHHFSHSIVHHHKDGTHTVHHVHEKHGHQDMTAEREGDVKGAAGDHDAMIDHMMDHTSAPNPGEEMAPPAAAAGPAGAMPPAAAGPAGA
jgi:broad specificity phosphatase PhoE